MGFCPQQCADWTQIANPTGGCSFLPRERQIARLLFFSCKLALPSPFTQSNTAALFANKSIVASMPLSNAKFGEPEIASINLADCIPDYEQVVSRELTAEDNIAVVLTDDPATTGVNEADEYWDYKFWKDKIDHRMMQRYGVAFCNGDVIIARDAAGKPMEASFNAFVDFKDKSAGKGKLEFKSIKLKFNGDPISFAKPDFNLNDFGIVL